jgi:hypothetical protein
MPDTAVPLAPPPGLNDEDTTFALPGVWADGSNMRFRQGRPETVGNIYTQWFSGLGGSVSAIIVTGEGTGIRYFLGSTTKLYVSPDGFALTDITPSGLVTAVAWSLHMFGSYLLAAPSGDTLYQYTGSGVATAVAPAPDKITCMIVNGKRQVLALGCNEEASGTFNGRCIRGSDLEDYSSGGSWTTSSSNNAFEHILDADTDIVAGCTMGDYEVVWTSSAMFLGQFLGNPGQAYDFTKIADVGLVSPKGFAITPGGLYFMAPDFRVFAWNAGGLPSVVPCPIFSDFAAHVERDVLSRAAIVAGYLGSFGEVWIFYADDRDGAATSLNTRYIALAVDESTAAGRPVWFRGQFGRTAISDGGALRTALPTMPMACMMGDGSGNAHLHDIPRTSGAGSAPASFIQSSDQYLDEGRRRIMVKRLRQDFEYFAGTGNISLTLYCRDYPQAPAVTKGPYTLTAEASGYQVNGSVSSGATSVLINQGTGGLAAGRQVTFDGVNEWANGADTGSLKRFTLTADFGGTSGTITLSEAIVSSGGSRNVVALPASGAAVTAIGNAAKKDFRASGLLIAAKFSAPSGAYFRLGKPVFDITPMGAR